MNDEFYSILEVPKNASETEIKKSYRKLMLQYHPDRNKSPDAEEKIKKINEAYEILGDKTKRQLYDSGQMHGGQHGGQQDMNNIFNMFFNGGGMPPGIRIFHNGMNHGFFIKPNPIQHVVVISLEQAFSGSNVEVNIVRTISRGNSVTKETERFEISIPAGTDNEMFILQEKGNSNENCKGDLHVIIQIENKTEFIRQNIDLIYKKKLSLKESLCGFSFEIKHLNGEILTISNKTSLNIIKPSHRMIISEKGMKREGFGKGNLIIEFEIEFPTNLSVEQIDSLRAIL
jgi:DnaJ family protein B protein 4